MALEIQKVPYRLTYLQQAVSSKDLTQVKQANFVNSLDGRVAGLHIQRSATGIGGATKATMRGARSLLVITMCFMWLDGMPIVTKLKEGLEAMAEIPAKVYPTLILRTLQRS